MTSVGGEFGENFGAAHDEHCDIHSARSRDGDAVGGAAVGAPAPPLERSTINRTWATPRE